MEGLGALLGHVLDNFATMALEVDGFCFDAHLVASRLALPCRIAQLAILGSPFAGIAKSTARVQEEIAIGRVLQSQGASISQFHIEDSPRQPLLELACCWRGCFFRKCGWSSGLGDCRATDCCK